MCRFDPDVRLRILCTTLVLVFLQQTCYAKCNSGAPETVLHIAYNQATVVNTVVFTHKIRLVVWLMTGRGAADDTVPQRWSLR
jgi:hypothetical protein